jgi:capsule polysaccharide export protein KpsE/RkpR
MAEIINLRNVRKQKARSAKEAQAEQNRISFGRTKAEKQLSAAEKALADKRIDGHRRDDQDQETP